MVSKPVPFYCISGTGDNVLACVFSSGLANRLVPQGQALSEAKLLARQILSFPQKCLRQDMRSSYHSAFSGLSLQERLRWEFEEGREVLEKESVPGAQRFAAGDGRGGAFDSTS